MIDGTAEIHWCTLYDEDGDPFGETCRCEVGRDHEEDELPDGVTPLVTDSISIVLGEEV